MPNRSRERDPFPVVGLAIRTALDRANDARITQREHRVLNAVIALVSSYSWLTDRVWVEEISDHARVDYRNTRRAIQRLRALGIIVYASTPGRGHKPLIGLPNGETRATSDPVFPHQNGDGTGPGSGLENRAADEPETGLVTTVKQGQRQPHSRVETPRSTREEDTYRALCVATRSDCVVRRTELEASFREITRMWHEEAGDPALLAAEIHSRVERLSERWRDRYPVTPKALAKHWSTAGPQPVDERARSVMETLGLSF